MFGSINLHQPCFFLKSSHCLIWPLASTKFWGSQEARGPWVIFILMAGCLQCFDRCRLGGRNGIRPVKTEWWGAGVVICLERGAHLHITNCLLLKTNSLLFTLLRFSKIQIGFTFLVPAHPGGIDRDKGPLNVCVLLGHGTLRICPTVPRVICEVTASSPKIYCYLFTGLKVTEMSLPSPAHVQFNA